MANLSVFAGEFDGSTIRVTEDGRFSVYDVLVAFKVCDQPNCQKTLKRIQDKYPEVVQKNDNLKFPGRGQRETPVATEEAILEILAICGKAPGQSPVTSDKFYPRPETQVMQVLAEAFSDCEPCPQFYCSGYRIDLYLAKYRIAVECDEYGHGHYSQTEEQARERAIKSALGCSFVRFDPYAIDFNIGTVIKQIRDLIR
ncbi:MAG: DUF559 domain-containing protein [Prochlorotrichaceae cyanobacterium]